MKRLLLMLLLFFISSNLNAQGSPSVKLNDKKQLKLSKLKVSADISNQYAKVTYDMTFYNGKNRILEGELAFPLGQGQSVSHLSMDLNGRLRDAVIVEKELGRVAYENTIQQRIDPALLEQTKGNNYKVRVYPIPAKGFKRIVVSYEQNLTVEDGNYMFQIPFDFKDELDEFELEITQNSRIVKPLIEGFFANKMNFRKLNGKFISKYLTKNFNAKENFNLTIPTTTVSNILMYEDFFFINLNMPSKLRLKSKPKSITLLWDASYSMLYKNKKKELELLNNYIKIIRDVQIDLVVFSNKIIQKKSFKLINGNWDLLRNELNTIVYDGGTSYVDLPLYNADEVILVSDGMHNLGDLNLKSVNRFYAINSVKSANHQMLKNKSNTIGGYYINLNRTSVDSGVEMLLNESYQFLGVVKNNRLFEVFPKVKEVVNGNFTIGGKRFNEDKVKLLFGFDGQVTDTIKVNLNTATNSSLAKRLWSKRKLTSLSKSKESNKEQIIEHCKDYHLISSYTSMIVLDRIEDYARYKIEPPKELMEQYKRIVTRNKQQEAARHITINNRRDDLKDEYEDLIEWYNKDFSLKPKIKKYPKKTTTSSSVSNSNSNSLNSSTIASIRTNERTPESDASKRSVSGIITAQSDGLPLPGVTIIVKGTTRGTQTDFDGKYTINVEVGETLIFSFVSMKTSEVNVLNLNNLNMALEDDTASLDEVVVTGYTTNTIAKSSVASVRLSSESIEERPNASLVQTLSGQVSGINISTDSGQPGANSLVQLRGVSSILGNSEPLFIVDGKPVSENSFRELNPGDIGTIRILKDAGATAIYGNRGTNGVIVITIKKGLENRSEEIEVLENKIDEQSTLKSWKKNAPYLALLNEQTIVNDAYELYLELRLEYHNTPSFFLDVAEYFESKGNYEYALRIATNLIEIEIDNHELIRALAYKLDQYEEYDLAVHVYKEVLDLRPEEPQSYRDLALAYEAIGEYQKAFDLFNKIVEGELIEKDLDSKYDGIERIAYLELSHLVHKNDVLKKYRDKIAKIKTDIRVVIDWNHADTDLDLHIKNPSKEELYYGKTTSKYGGLISDDFIDGYGPETFKLKKAQKGEYKVSIKYFSDRVQKITGPTILKLTTYKNYGSSNESKEIKIFRLTNQDGKIKANTLTI